MFRKIGVKLNHYWLFIFTFPFLFYRNYFNKYAVQNGRPGTPGNNSAVMGIVGPPTPVGMVQQQITPSLNPSMMGNHSNTPAAMGNHPSMMANPAVNSNLSMMHPPSNTTSMNANRYPMMPNPAMVANGNNMPVMAMPVNPANVPVGSMGVPMMSPASMRPGRWIRQTLTPI